MDARASFKKLWLLAILQAVRAAGIGAASSAFVHRLVYFTTALAVVSRQEPEVACVIKRDVGPYFPDYAWELERLVGMGLVTTRKQFNDIADLDTHTLYKISSEGLELLGNVAASVTSLKEIIHHVGFCIRELAFSGVLQDQGSWEADANQKSRTQATGELIDYGEIQPSSRVNFSAIEAAQLLGISIEAFESPIEASETLRRGISWDQRESNAEPLTSLKNEYVPGLCIADLLPLHGPSLFARNLGIRRGFHTVQHSELESHDSGSGFLPPDVGWANEELEGILT